VSRRPDKRCPAHVRLLQAHAIAAAGCLQGTQLADARPAAARPGPATQGATPRHAAGACMRMASSGGCNQLRSQLNNKAGSLQCHSTSAPCPPPASHHTGRGAGAAAACGPSHHRGWWPLRHRGSQHGLLGSVGARAAAAAGRYGRPLPRSAVPSEAGNLGFSAAREPSPFAPVVCTPRSSNATVTALTLANPPRPSGLPEPAVACLSAMPWPHIPVEQRPWRQQRLLNEEEFKVGRPKGCCQGVPGAGVVCSVARAPSRSAPEL
jgi:hypothetical protein